MRNLLVSICLLVLLFTGVRPVWCEIHFLEAESFDTRGGWVVDQQGMDQIGSAYLLAHGMGKPVADASTSVRIGRRGTYAFHVRTRDWVRPYGPGRFFLIVNGVVVDSALGVGGDGQWSWWEAGRVTLDTGAAAIALRDLTGLEGRCDAVVLSDEPGFSPPNDAAALRSFRLLQAGVGLTPRDAGTFDVVVVGGGFAGMAAALSSARLGLQTCLIQDRPVLGGNASSEIRVPPEGKTKGATYPVLGEITDEFRSPRTSSALEKLFTSQPNMTLCLDQRVNKVTVNGMAISEAIAQSTTTGELSAYKGRLFVDCTGDGAVGFLAGADYRYGREGKSEFNERSAPAAADSMTMGATLAYWRASNVSRLDTFPNFPWGLEFSSGCSYTTTGGDWTWESGFWVDKPRYIEYVRDLQFRAIYGNWSYLKRTNPTYATYTLTYVPFVLGTRESRRLVGDLVYTENDLSVAFDDGCVVRGWKVDLHCPDTLNWRCFPAREFRSNYCGSRATDAPPPVRDTLLAKSAAAEATNGLVPYRCFYSRNIDNLFMAGRCASISHVAFGSTRVMKTGGVMGEVVGRAAYLCVAKNTTPRGVYEQYLPDLISLFSVSLPASGVVKASAPSPVARLTAAPPRRVVLPLRSGRVLVVSSGRAYDLRGRVEPGRANVSLLRTVGYRDLSSGD